MKKVAKAILLAGIALVALLALGVLGVNLYVQSAGVQEQIRTALTEGLGRPVTTGGVNFTPWSGLVLRDIQVRESAAPGAGLFLEATGLRARLKFSSLFRPPVIIRDVALESPKVTWRQSEAGRYQLAEEIPGTAEPAETAPNATPEPPSSTPRARHAAAAPPKIDLQVEALHMHQGTFEFQDRQGARLALLEGVEVDCPTATPEVVAGTARIARATFRSGVAVQNLTAPFRYTPEELSITKLAAGIARGQVEGNFRMQMQAPNAPYAADLQFTGVDLDQVLTETGLPAGQVAGLAEGAFTWQSDTRDPNQGTGQGHLSLDHAQIRQYDLLAQLGQALQIEELRQLELQEARAEWHVGEGRIVIDQIVMQSANLKLTAHGKAKMDGRLDLDARLTINGKIGRQLPEFVESNFRPVENSDQRYLDFDISGTATNPRTNLMQQILGQHLKEGVSGLLDNIFGGKKKGEKKEKKPAKDEEPEH